MKKNFKMITTLWLNFVAILSYVLAIFQQAFRDFGNKYPNLLQSIQLTFLYFFTIIDLVYSVLNTVYSLGYTPELLTPFTPLIKWILQAPFFQILASPEKVFFLSYVVIEFMVVRSTFGFSKLVRYNILLLFALVMLQGLMISYWDLFFHREIAPDVAKWSFDQGTLLFTDKSLAALFFLNTFLVFFFVYIILYIIAVRGHFFAYPPLAWLTDSISFWLKIKTSTMPFGKRKKKD